MEKRGVVGGKRRPRTVCRQFMFFSDFIFLKCTFVAWLEKKKKKGNQAPRVMKKEKKAKRYENQKES